MLETEQQLRLSITGRQPILSRW